MTTNHDPVREALRGALPFVAFAFSKGMLGAEGAGRNIEAALTTPQPSPLAAPMAEGEAAALTHEQIAEFGLGLEYVHDVLRWAACGYVHTPERIAQLHTSYRIVDKIVNAPAAVAVVGAREGEQLRLALRDFLAWFIQAQTVQAFTSPRLQQAKILHREIAQWGALSPPTPSADLKPVPLVNEARERLARRLLWIAFAWNDYNFDAAHLWARREAEALGIKSFEEANAWLAARSAPAGVVKGDAT